MGRKQGSEVSDASLVQPRHEKRKTGEKRQGKGLAMP